jgi:glycosyltransferase involved in cell wall biosynthesis
MINPVVSVIIPTYNGEAFLADTIQSVLDQIYTNFELIIVDDGSVDDTIRVINQFDDSRIKFVNLGKNCGADTARNVGIHQSNGNIIAFLDQDDLFHPEKLQVHVDYLEQHPLIGFTYNHRYELNYSSETIREIAPFPKKMTLKDIVLFHKLSPSEMVFRKEWALRVGLLDETHNFHGGEIIFLGKLYFEGCKFANVNRVLNYRRYHAERIYKNLPGICQDERDAQDKIFYDSRCPKKIQALRNIAHVNMYLYFICLAFAQKETAIGQQFVREAVRLNPIIIDNDPCQLVESFLINSIDDETKDHEEILERFFNQLPPELIWLSEQKNWAISRGYFDKGVRAIIWDRVEDGKKYLSKFAGLTDRLDESFFQSLTYQLMNYETEFGSEKTEETILRLEHQLNKFDNLGNLLQLQSNYIMSRAFHAYKNDKYNVVLRRVLTAITYNPKYITNRGTLSIFFRSILKMFASLFHSLYRNWI